ncbi:MAG: riboflavin kinase [Candidatus Pacebacteria bacterium]|nr:riboflavin kinase [Candidatus Paceibacterota bacterium]
MQYKISGKVIKGDGYGNKIGFPTLNLDRKKFLALDKKPSFGVYVGLATLNKKQYKAGIVIGPLDKKSLPKIEAHLIGYKGNAYSKKATLELNKFIRKFKSFKTEKELIAQIKKDIKICSQA